LDKRQQDETWSISTRVVGPMFSPKSRAPRPEADAEKVEKPDDPQSQR
jgi:hypothetical protein